tara:strand:+ start:107 stop:346 length:240 start_codon:yes stop_codon:yes gene_type:complete
MKKIILSLCILVYTLFLNTSSLFAEEIDENMENNISNQIEQIKPEKNKPNEISKSSIEDIFGDEQTFPFVAGLGKNAAH